MLTMRQFLLIAAIICSGLSLAQAQQSTTPGAPVITASGSAERVRFTAPSNVVRMQLQIISETGQVLFDVGSKGNVLDWSLQDSGGQRLQGSYLTVVTVKSLSGRVSERIGSVSIAEKQVELQPADTMRLSTVQQQAVGPLEENAALTILKAGEVQAATVAANNGSDGQIIRDRALSFRSGDFFSGRDTRQMRLTKVGSLGVGTNNPQAKLDVARVVLTSKRIEFENGNKLTTTAKGSRQQTLADGPVAANLTLTGTLNKIAKWTDNAGTLGDAAITETGGTVVVGNLTQPGTLQIFGPANSDVFAGMGPDLLQGPAFTYGYAGSIGRSVGFFNVRPDAAATAPNPSLRFLTANQQRMIVTNTGNVGIGTTAPSALMEIAHNGASAFGTALQIKTIAGTDGPRVAFEVFHGGNPRRWSLGIRNTSFGVFEDGYSGGFGTERFTILPGGSVGIGTTAPGAPLEVQVGAGQSLQFRQDSGLVPGINVKTTGGNAGVMRLRNAVEVWPSDDATRAGKVDVRNTAGSPTISLDGQTGVASFRNMPGVSFSQLANGGNVINPGLPPVEIDSLTVNAPAAGFIFVSAFVYATTSEHRNYLFDFTLSNEGAYLVNTKAIRRTKYPIGDDDVSETGEVPVHLSWVIPVSNAGTFHLKTVLYYDDFGASGDRATVKSHNLTAIYLPVQY
ncbi:MAG: hypothetical protein ABI596_16315 [Pyrinomonadaceae bacterium]